MNTACAVDLTEYRAAFDHLVYAFAGDINDVYFWFAQMLTEDKPLCNKNVLWCNGEVILAANSEIANTVADWLDELFDCATTGYYDPEYDKQWGMEDECTGYWYVDI